MKVKLPPNDPRTFHDSGGVGVTKDAWTEVDDRIADRAAFERDGLEIADGDAPAKTSDTKPER